MYDLKSSINAEKLIHSPFSQKSI